MNPPLNPPIPPPEGAVCPNCGASLQGDEKLCPRCGHALPGASGVGCLQVATIIVLGFVALISGAMGGCALIFLPSTFSSPTSSQDPLWIGGMAIFCLGIAVACVLGIRNLLRRNRR